MNNNFDLLASALAAETAVNIKLDDGITGIWTALGSGNAVTAPGYSLSAITTIDTSNSSTSTDLNDNFDNLNDNTNATILNFETQYLDNAFNQDINYMISTEYTAPQITWDTTQPSMTSFSAGLNTSFSSELNENYSVVYDSLKESVDTSYFILKYVDYLSELESVSLQSISGLTRATYDTTFANGTNYYNWSSLLYDFSSLKCVQSKGASTSTSVDLMYTNTSGAYVVGKFDLKTRVFTQKVVLGASVVPSETDATFSDGPYYVFDNTDTLSWSAIVFDNNNVMITRWIEVWDDPIFSSVVRKEVLCHSSKVFDSSGNVLDSEADYIVIDSPVSNTDEYEYIENSMTSYISYSGNDGNTGTAYQYLLYRIYTYGVSEDENEYRNYITKVHYNGSLISDGYTQMQYLTDDDQPGYNGNSYIVASGDYVYWYGYGIEKQDDEDGRIYISAYKGNFGTGTISSIFSTYQDINPEPDEGSYLGSLSFNYDVCGFYVGASDTSDDETEGWYAYLYQAGNEITSDTSTTNVPLTTTSYSMTNTRTPLGLDSEFFVNGSSKYRVVASTTGETLSEPTISDEITSEAVRFWFIDNSIVKPYNFDASKYYPYFQFTYTQHSSSETLTSTSDYQIYSGKPFLNSVSEDVSDYITAGATIGTSTVDFINKETLTDPSITYDLVVQGYPLSANNARSYIYTT